LTRSYLGIGVAEIDAQRAKTLKLAEERGVEITRVEPDSPAEKAGLKAGDVVLEYNGQRVEGTEQFMRLVRETPPGRKVTLLISREGTTQTVTATIGRRRMPAGPLGPDFEANMERLRESLRHLRIELDAPRAFVSWRSSMLGIEAESLTQQLAEFFGVKEGVLVRSVMRNTPAEKAGLKAGDVITKVDGEAVRTPAQVASRLRASRSKETIPLTVVRNRQEMTLSVRLEPEGKHEREALPRPRTISAEKGVRL
jgi:serine protease Do